MRRASAARLLPSSPSTWSFVSFRTTTQCLITGVSQRAWHETTLCTSRSGLTSAWDIADRNEKNHLLALGWHSWRPLKSGKDVMPTVLKTRLTWTYVAGHKDIAREKKLGTKTTTTHVANWRCSTDSLPQRSTLQCQLLPVHLVSNGFGEDLRWRGGGFQLNFGMPLQLACPCRLTKGTNILERKWTGSLPTCAGIQPRSIICMLSASILPLRGPRNNCLSSPCGSTVCSCRWIRATVSVFRAA